MDASEVTLNRIIEDFSKTIFWNNYKPWPGEGDPPEGPLAIHERGLGDTGFIVAFESGDMAMTVASLPPLSPSEDDGSDFANRTANHDAIFIAMLPVYIPWLLEQLRFMQRIAEGYSMCVDNILDHKFRTNV